VDSGERWAESSSLEGEGVLRGRGRMKDELWSPKKTFPFIAVRTAFGSRPDTVTTRLF
jgi:hypothetical protein